MSKHRHSKGKHQFFGSVKVGERGQIVIPIKARELFKIEAGDQLLVFGDIDKGLGIIKASELNQFASQFFSSIKEKGEESQNEE
ncbi:MAG: AbrB family transcriptional regulator [Promethearchaeota archaeon]|nr:MAG: AbrB family transcriptional regulator [Candidatus Lokiarchaeota archaeon]